VTDAPPKTILPWVVLALVVAAGATVAPLAVPVILAAWVSTISRPLLDRVARALKGRERAAAVLTVLLLIVLALPITVLIAGLVSGIGELTALVAGSEGAPAALKALVSDAGSEPLELFGGWERWLAWAQRYSGQLYQLVGGIAGTALRLTFGLLVFFLGVWTFLLEGPRIRKWYDAHVPLGAEALRRFADAFTETGRGLLIGVGLTSAAQALAATVIYIALGVPRAIVLGLVTGLATFVPVAGGALVWLPVAAGLYLTDHPVKAAVMIGLGTLIISSIDNVLRPIFSRYGKLNLSVLMLVVSVFGGLAVFGPFGALIGPLIVRLAKEGLALLREERDAAAAAGPGPSGR